MVLLVAGRVKVFLRLFSAMAALLQRSCLAEVKLDHRNRLIVVSAASLPA